MNHAIHTMVMSDDYEPFKGGAHGREGSRTRRLEGFMEGRGQGSKGKGIEGEDGMGTKDWARGKKVR